MHQYQLLEDEKLKKRFNGSKNGFQLFLTASSSNPRP